MLPAERGNLRVEHQKEILEATGGAGVDVVLNSLTGEGVTAAYLLPTTATTFFERAGYTANDRATVPPSIAVGPHAGRKALTLHTVATSNPDAYPSHRPALGILPA